MNANGAATLRRCLDPRACGEIRQLGKRHEKLGTTVRIARIVDGIHTQRDLACFA